MPIFNGDSWIQVWHADGRGRKFHPLAPRVEEVDITSIAHALSMMNRFTGATREPYSVGEHCVRAARAVFAARRTLDSLDDAATIALKTLLHDASEAYLVDVARPVKLAEGFQFYRDAERKVQDVIYAAFDLPAESDLEPIVREADERMLATEVRDLMQPAPESWHMRAVPYEVVVEPWGWRSAEGEFLDDFHRFRSAIGPIPSVGLI